jgi:hypothetical protein
MDNIILCLLELAMMILHHETHYISSSSINNDKHLAPIIPLYVLIFNAEKYNSYEHFGYPWFLSMVCISFTYLI